MISAGVAAAQVGIVKKAIREQFLQPPSDGSDPPYAPSHLPALKRAHQLWKIGRALEACGVLERALSQFPGAVTLRAEYALCLAAAGDLARAREQVGRLQRLCHIFRDHEMLCRLGRIFKDSGDELWAGDRSPPDHSLFIAGGHPAWQLYREAFDLYLEAFRFSGHYFPGINAATLALLTGQDDAGRALADEVLEICRTAGTADMEERYWIYATEGEACLIKGAPDRAVTFYRAALSNPCAKHRGMVQATYNQLCRLSWALGTEQVKIILDELAARGLLAELETGPFGNGLRARK